MILVSYPPFLHHTALGIKEKIIQGIYEFHPEYWGHISREAKDFVSRLLTVDVELRMTAEEALLHPWVSTLDVICFAYYRSSRISLKMDDENN
jgi:serine/threonine protein kinase